jgi:hypothetical protein
MAEQEEYGEMVLWSPVWIIALVLAVTGPWFVGVFADRLEARVRRRTQALLSSAANAAQIANGARGPSALGGESSARAGKG